MVCPTTGREPGQGTLQIDVHQGCAVLDSAAHYLWLSLIRPSDCPQSSEGLFFWCCSSPHFNTREAANWEVVPGKSAYRKLSGPDTSVDGLPCRLKWSMQHLPEVYPQVSGILRFFWGVDSRAAR